MMFNPFATLKSGIITGCIMLLLSVGIIQTLRIEGFWFIKGYEQRLVKAKKRETAALAAAEACDRESKIAEAKAKANAARVKVDYERIATNAKQDYDRALTANRTSVERWKLQNRRGPTRQGDSAATAEIPTGIAGAETLSNIPSGFVLVPESDLDKTAVIQATLFALQEAARQVEGVRTAPD